MAKTKQNTPPVGIAEDSTEYIIVAFFPDDGSTEILGVGTQAFGLKLGVSMDRNVNLMFI